MGQTHAWVYNYKHEYITMEELTRVYNFVAVSVHKVFYCSLDGWQAVDREFTEKFLLQHTRSAVYQAPNRATSTELRLESKVCGYHFG